MTIALAGTAHALEPMVADLAGANGGVLGWPQLERLGHSPDDVARWVRAGQLVRVRRGAYVVGDVWRSADADDRYRLTVLAVVRSRGGSEVVSRHSALALWDLPLWAVDRALVVLSSDVEESQTRSGLRLSPLRSLVADEPRHGVRLEAVADAVVTTASFSVEAAVVAGDAAVHSGLCTPADLADAAARLRPSLRGRRRVDRALASIDPLCESPGESRTRLLLVALGLPVESQVVIRDAFGRFVARVDLLVAGRVVVEFDGAVKYAGHDGARALVAEKQREDALRALGYQVVRVTWPDLSKPEQVRALVFRALARAAA